MHFLTGADPQGQRLIKKTLIFSIVLNIVVTILPIIIGYFSQIRTLTLDGIHSLGDLVSDIILLIIFPLAYQKQDFDHRYGHERYENILTLFLGIAIAGSALVFLHDATQELFFSKQIVHTPSKWAWGITIFTIISKEIAYRITIYVGHKTKSSMLIANGIHHRTDAFSSIIVLLTLIGLQIGWENTDAITAIAFGGYLLYTGMGLLWDSIHILADKAPLQEIQLVEDILLNTNGVLGLHDLRLRQSGPFIMGDVHIEVNGELTIIESHSIIKEAQQKIRQELPQMQYFVIHTDPYKDKV